MAPSVGVASGGVVGLPVVALEAVGVGMGEPGVPGALPRGATVTSTPSASSCCANRLRTAATGSAGPGLPPVARWLDRPSMATAPVMPELRKVGLQVGAVVGPSAYVSST